MSETECESTENWPLMPEMIENTHAWSLAGEGRLTEVTAIAVLGGGLFGLDIGVVGSVLQMADFERRFEGDVWEFGLISSGMNIGALIFCGLALHAALTTQGHSRLTQRLPQGPLAERFGRRDTVAAAALAFTVLAFWQGASNSFGMLFAGRVLSGGTIALCATIVPVYISELSPPEIRGSLVSLQQSAIGFSIMLIYWVAYAIKGVTPDDGYLADWRICFYLSALPSLVLFVCITTRCPRSPRWLLSNGREEEAEAALLVVRGKTRHSAVLLELAQLRRDIQSERQLGNSSCGQLVGTASMRRITAAAFGVQLFQQIQGINCIMYFGPMVVKGFGLDGNLFTVALVDKLGRKPLLLVGSVIMFLTMCTIGLIGTADGFRDPETDAYVLKHGSYGVVCILCFVVYLAGFSATWGPVGWLIPSEIFPMRHRSRGIVVAAYANWSSNALLGFCFPAALKYLGFATYFVFATFCVVAMAFVHLTLPETRGVLLEDMEKLFEDPQNETSVATTISKEHNLCKRNAKSHEDEDITLL